MVLKRALWLFVLLALLPLPAARAQETGFPLPAPLYILTSQQRLLRVDPMTGEQQPISPEGQPVADFAIAPDGAWYVYRSPANDAVIVTEIEGGSGYVLEFDVLVPPSSPASTIDWAPDASAIAYIVDEGVRVADLGAGEFGDPVLSTIQGSWDSLYWETPEALIARAADGSATRISGQAGAWTVAPAPAAPPQAQLAVRSHLSPEGVVLDDGSVVPRTAGALAFEWGPPPLPVIEGVAPLPRDLYYIAPAAAGVEQVWRLPASGDAASALTESSDSVLSFDIAPGAIAFVAGGHVWSAAPGSAERRPLGMVELEHQGASVAWSADAARLAYHDRRGLWIVDAAGSQPPHLLVASAWPDEQTAPMDVRVYVDPRWSPDGSRLLATIGLYEGALLGVVDVSSGDVTVLEGVGVAEAAWTPDGRVLAWSQHGMYGTAGLYLLDPAAPSAPPVHLVPAGTPVLDAARGEDGRWYALIASTAGMGPQWARAWVAESLEAGFAPLYEGETGGFVQQPQLAPPNPPDAPSAVAAGFEKVTYDPTARGALVVLSLQDGAAVRVQGADNAHALRWAP